MTEILKPDPRDAMSPAALVLAVKALLAERGIAVRPVPNGMHAAAMAAGDLLRALGVAPARRTLGGAPMSGEMPAGELVADLVSAAFELGRRLGPWAGGDPLFRESLFSVVTAFELGRKVERHAARSRGCRDDDR